MESIKKFFFDTYAFFEILEGNPHYLPYTQNTAIITTKMNLMELYYGLLLKYGKEEAEKRYQEYVDFTIAFDDNTIKRASELKAILKNRKLSYVDCLGYTIAKTTQIKFLTGDQQFKDLDNVEFVK